MILLLACLLIVTNFHCKFDFNNFLTLPLFSGVAFAGVEIATGEYPPFVSESMPEKGLAMAIAKEACLSAQLECKFEFYPWLRAEMLVRSGKDFAAFPYAVSEERKKHFNFSKPLVYTAPVLAYSKDNPNAQQISKISSIDDIKKFKISIFRGSYLESILKSFNIEYELSNQIDFSLKKLDAHRVDIFIDEYSVFMYNLKLLFPNKLSKFQVIRDPEGHKISFLQKTPVGFLVSKSYVNGDKLLEKLNSGIEKFQKTKKYHDMIEAVFLFE